jgi:hypothetical protein
MRKQFDQRTIKKSILMFEWIVSSQFDLIVEELIKYNKERMYESESEEREERD